MTEPVDAIVIRPLKAADVDQLIAFSLRMAQVPAWPRETYEAILDAGFPRRIALVAEEKDQEEVAGVVVAVVVSPESELELIAVAPEWQRRGLARRLFGELRARLSSEGVTKVLLEVRESNQGAREFYRTLGFGETGRRVRYYADPVEDAVQMKFDMA